MRDWVDSGAYGETGICAQFNKICERARACLIAAGIPPTGPVQETVASDLGIDHFVSAPAT